MQCTLLKEDSDRSDNAIAVMSNASQNIDESINLGITDDMFEQVVLPCYYMLHTNRKLMELL